MVLRYLVQFVANQFAPALVGHTITTTTLAFVPSTAHNTRLAASAITIALCMESIRRNPRQTYEEAGWADYMFGLAFHTNCYLVLLNLTPPATLTHPLQKLHWGINALFSPRMGTKPYRPYPPTTTKRQFLLRRLTLLTLLTAFWLYIRTGEAFYPPNLNSTDWTPAHTYLLPQLLTGTLTLRHLWLRTTLAFYSHAGSALVINGAHAFCSLVAVGIFNSPPASWPPLFGSLAQAYSLRRWYSHFWHQAMRRAFTIHAAAFTERVLGLRKATAAGRAAIVLGAFFLSGCMHAVTGWRAGMCEGGVRPVGTFLGFAVFMLLEQGVQGLFFGLRGRLGVPWTRWEEGVWRAVGFAWVVYFMLEFMVWGSFWDLQCMERMYEV